MDSREYRTSVTEGVGRDWVGTSWFSFNFAINLKTPSPYVSNKLKVKIAMLRAAVKSHAEGQGAGTKQNVDIYPANTNSSGKGKT